MNTKTIIGIIIGALIIVVGGFVLTMDKKPASPEYTTKSPREREDITEAVSPTSTTPSTGTSSATTPPVQAESSTQSQFKDGTYSTTGSYISPAGAEEIAVTLTLKEDTVVSATVVGKATNPASIRWQQQFNAGYSAQVVGRLIEDISLNVVNGSSLTPKGFNEALIKIKSDASIAA